MYIQDAIDEKLSHMKGRPALCILEKLAMLLGYHFKVTDIAHILVVYPRTIRRRIIPYGLEDAASDSDVSDNDLDSISSNFVHHNPNSRLRSLEGLLRSQGIRIQCQRELYLQASTNNWTQTVVDLFLKAVQYGLP